MSATKCTEKSLKFHLICGFVVRLLLILYGNIHDSYITVKYTDIDYSVFSDAANYVFQGRSPYERSTYRYTPLLSWALIPTVFLPSFGKVLFVLLDILCSALIYELVRKKVDHKLALTAAFLWLYNPLAIGISTRGSAESILAVLVLSVFYFIQTERIMYAGLIYGLSVHMKIYPVIYALPFYLYLGRVDFSSCKTFVMSLLPGRDRWTFTLVSAGTFLTLTWIFYCCYGYQFLEETYLYHVTRKDTRHNFSPYFYLLYLTNGQNWASSLGILAFLPQAFLLVLVSIYCFDDLPFCCFLSTFIFVTFNKVCTSQYFLWYLCLLPVLIPKLGISLKKACILASVWLSGQGLWLLAAYLLEFEGLCTFVWIWMAGLILFAVNVCIADQVLKAYSIKRS